MKHVRRLPVRDVTAAKAVISRLCGTVNAGPMWGRPPGYWVIREMRYRLGELTISVEPHDGKPAFLAVRVDKPWLRRVLERLRLARCRRPRVEQVMVPLKARDWGEIAAAEKVGEAKPC